MKTLTIRELIARKINMLCTQLLEANWEYKFENNCKYVLYTFSNGKLFVVSYEVLQFGYHNCDTTKEHVEIEKILNNEYNLSILQEML